jgi:two-component system, NarL family, sensor histidine kinase DegS
LTFKDIIAKTQKIIRNPGFWLIIALITLITLPYYINSLNHPTFVNHFLDNLDMTRDTFERVLYLAPIIYAVFIFGWRGSFYVSLITVAIMLPKAIMAGKIADNVFEIAVVFSVGNVVSLGFSSLKREREYRRRLENARRELIISEERYRKLFENALDGIWTHDLEGNFTSFNKASEMMIGYSTEEISKMNAKKFLSQESLDLANHVRRKLLHNEYVEQPYEQKVFTKDGREIYIQLSTSLITDKGKPIGFQNIARDITEQKRMNENLRNYLQLATRAQEEERKRISHELHDDTIQLLIALSRQLDALASAKGVPDDVRQKLEDLWNQTDNIVKGVRRLSQDLRPAAIDRLGLLPAIRWLAEESEKYSGIKTRVNVIGKEHRLPEEAAIALFRIIQEALRNVSKHSGATRAGIIVEFHEKKTRITIADNGKGFTPPDQVGDLPKIGKLGLAGMQERVQLLGGAISMQSEPGKGTTITVEMPC